MCSPTIIRRHKETKTRRSTREMLSLVLSVISKQYDLGGINIVIASNYCAFFEKTFLNLFFLIAVRHTAMRPTLSEEKIPISLGNLFHNSGFLIRNSSN